jgi:hypothetical protein
VLFVIKEPKFIAMTTNKLVITFEVNVQSDGGELYKYISERFIEKEPITTKELLSMMADKILLLYEFGQNSDGENQTLEFKALEVTALL